MIILGQKWESWLINSWGVFSFPFKSKTSPKCVLRESKVILFSVSTIFLFLWGFFLTTPNTFVILVILSTLRALACVSSPPARPRSGVWLRCLLVFLQFLGVYMLTGLLYLLSHEKSVQKVYFWNTVNLSFVEMINCGTYFNLRNVSDLYSPPLFLPEAQLSLPPPGVSFHYKEKKQN